MNAAGVVVSCALALTEISGCASGMADFDDIYTRTGERYVLCASNVDDAHHIASEQIDDAFDRAIADGTTVQLYAHRPGGTVQLTTIEGILAAAAEHGMELTTYDQLSAGVVPGGLALSFDDHSLAEWTALRPMFARYGARVTFFISEFLDLTDDEQAQLRQLADDGHDIEYHSTHHLNAVHYAAAHGIDAYVADEIRPALDAMRAAGYPTTVFAYPFGARDDAIDAALAPYFTHLRAIRTTCPW
jgi:hypothetical protein